MSYIIVGDTVINTDDVPVGSEAFEAYRHALADRIDGFVDNLEAGDPTAWALWWHLFRDGESEQ